MLSSSCELSLTEKCKISAWMEQFQNAVKVQSKFKLEFSKHPPPVSEITQIHQRFMTTGSVIDYSEDSSIPSEINTEGLLNGNISDACHYKEIAVFTPENITLKEKWKDSPKIKIRDTQSNAIKNEVVSIAPDDLNEDEIKECMIEISLNEENNIFFLDCEKNHSKNTRIQCGHKSSDELSHSQHLKVHDSSDFFNCPNCNFTCNSTSSLRSHRTACKPLDFEKHDSSSSASDNTAVDSSGSGPSKQKHFICRTCNGRYAAENISDKNLSNVDKWKQCDCQCSKPSDVSSSFNSISKPQHQTSWTADSGYGNSYVLKVNDSQISQVSRVRTYSCDQCSFTTQKKVSLKNHKTIHYDDEEMKHECPLCGQKFRSKRSLSYHTDNNHIDKEILECPFCDFRQKNKILLQIHMRRHTGEKPYKCEIPFCDFKARISQEIRRHIQMEHSVK